MAKRIERGIERGIERVEQGMRAALRAALVVAVAVGGAALLTSCGGEADSGGSASAPGLPQVDAGQGGEAAVSGLYEVSGRTTEIETGREREVSGTIIISQERGRYTSTFSLRTMFPTPNGPAPAEVIGRGEGTVQGSELVGTAETQVVMSTVPGVDASFAYVPRRVSQRIVSDSVAKVTPDGRVTIEISNAGAEGAPSYAKTRTTLQGELVSRAGRTVPLR